MVFSGVKAFLKSEIPDKIRFGSAIINASSAVMYGSHSQALMINVSICFKLEIALTSVGKVAPPIPTKPASRIIANSSSAVICSGSWYGVMFS